jgi:hypothetical protein
LASVKARSLVCDICCIQNQFKIGGPGTTVKIDECLPTCEKQASRGLQLSDWYLLVSRETIPQSFFLKLLNREISKRY